MNPQQIRLIAIDVDGTLLDSNHRLTSATVQVLTMVQNLGVVVTLSTGKILPSVREVVLELELNAPLILANGALIQYPDGSKLHKHPVPKRVLEAGVALCSISETDFALYTSEQIFVQHLNYNTLLVVEYDEPMPRVLGQWPPKNMSGFDVYKLLLINRHSDVALSAMESKMRKILSGMANVQRSVPAMLEITSSQASKSQALQILSRHLGIHMTEVMAIGDSFNDIDMFQVAGFSVAMGNAPSDVKQAAKFVVGTNDEDGIAVFLTDLLLTNR